MLSSTAILPNKNKFHSLFFYSSLLLEIRCEFQTDHLPECRISLLQYQGEQDRHWCPPLNSHQSSLKFPPNNPPISGAVGLLNM